jgi:hypothetical protein
MKDAILTILEAAPPDCVCLRRGLFEPIIISCGLTLDHG